jgi:hypothetical protein
MAQDSATPFMIACANGHERIVQMIFDNVEIQDINDNVSVLGNCNGCVVF